MERLLWFVFAATRGGPTRIRIVQLLLDEPANVNAVARRLGLDYKTVEYNLRVLARHALVTCLNPGTYGALYVPSKNLLAMRDGFQEICVKLVPQLHPVADLGKRSSIDVAREVPK